VFILLPDGYASQRVHYCRPLCVYMTTPTGRGGGSLFWQRMPLSRLALAVNRDVQCSAVILYSAVISIIMHCTSRLTGHARCDNSTHCQDNALPPPRRLGVAVHYFCLFTEKQKKVPAAKLQELLPVVP